MSGRTKFISTAATRRHNSRANCAL